MSEGSYSEGKMSVLDEFKVVNRRRKSKRFPRGVHRLTADGKNDRQQFGDPEIDVERVKQGISEGVELIETSNYGNILFRGVDKALGLIGAPELSEVVCYGLGNFSQSRASKFQLAAVLKLKSRYRSTVHVYDPLFYDSETSILKDLDLKIIDDNEEAKRTIVEKASLIYMPHCPYQLTNNLIHANWSRENLSNCLILSNSFSELADSIYSRDIEESTNYIARINPYTTEIELKNTFEYEEVFNGSSIHIFQEKNLSEIPTSYWDRRDSPIYRTENCDFVRRSRSLIAELPSLS